MSDVSCLESSCREDSSANDVGDHKGRCRPQSHVPLQRTLGPSGGHGQGFSELAVLLIT